MGAPGKAAIIITNKPGPAQFRGPLRRSPARIAIAGTAGGGATVRIYGPSWDMASRLGINLAVRVFSSGAAPILHSIVRPVTRLDRSNCDEARNPAAPPRRRAGAGIEPYRAGRAGRRDRGLGRCRHGRLGRSAARDFSSIWQHGERLSARLMLNPYLGTCRCRSLGGLLFGVASEIIQRWRPEREIDPIEANALHGGRMSLLGSIIVAAQTVWSSGVGASVGLEAGYTQFASGIASRIGNRSACAAATCAFWSVAAPPPALPARSARRSPALFTALS